MDTNGPYFESQNTIDRVDIRDDADISTNAFDSSDLTNQASVYPDLPQVDASVDSNPHLHNLVEAATTAAVREHLDQDEMQPARYPLDDLLEDTQHYVPDNSVDVETIRDTQEASDSGPRRAKKRKRLTEDRITPVCSDNSTYVAEEYNPSSSIHLVDARANGVHSAAALFRAPTDKKSTRPQMSKMFDSLALSPEDFLRLQAAAKKYMLDPERPERRDSVGNRGKTDTGQVRLELHKCVRNFLEEGAGATFFGPRSQSPAGDAQTLDVESRGFAWPFDKERIVNVCIPLLRRMVTNERQRQYAIESRKGTKSAEDSAHTASEHATNDSVVPSSHLQTPTIQMYFLDKDSQQSLRDRVDLPLYDSMGWDYVNDVAKGHASGILRMDNDGEGTFELALRVQVLKSTGLQDVRNDDEWHNAVQEAVATVWMEKVVKVVIYSV